MLYECEKISTLVIPAQIYKINSYAFSGSGVTNAVLPDTLTSLGANLFNDCDKLISIQLPSNSDITTIPEGLCKSCPALKSVNIPEGYDTISNSAFSYSALVGITLPSTITSIEDSAFYDCESMQFVQFTSPAVPSFSGESQFKYATSMFKVFCPAGTESLYQTSMADAANTLGLPEKTSFVGKSEKVTTIPVLSGEITVTGTLTVGTPISNLKLSGTFLNGLNNTPITGTLRWEQPNKSFPAGYASEELIWVFTPAASYGSGAMTLTGTYQYSSYISATSSGTNGNTTVVINKSGNQTSVTLSKPGRPAIKSVKKKGKKAITVKWKKAIYGATGYHIAISTKKNKSFKIKKTVAKWYSLSTIIKGLKKGKTYYIKVRAYKKVNGVRVTGNYSKVKKIKL